MQTLTITDARKNLGRWLQAAARGEDIGIISGRDIIALRKVRIESADYAMQEYGATEDRIARAARSTDQRYRRLNRAGKLTVTTQAELRRLLEETVGD